MPPQGSYQWTGAVSAAWATGGNWLLGNEPTLNADNVHFTAAPAANGPEAQVNGIPTKTLRSLWFDAAVGYTLNPASPTDTLTLGFGLLQNQHLIAIRRNDGTNTISWGAETNINPAITLHNNGAVRTWRIENHSEGGLGLNGALNLNGNGLRIAGSRATRFGGQVSGSGAIEVASGGADSPTHLVLAANNNPGGGATPWSGALYVRSQAFGIVKASTGLGSGANSVYNGGTIGWRRHNAPGTLATYAAQPIQVEGMGIVRQNGIDPVGAIYNDGGNNLFWDNITMTGDTWFGSRGDLRGNLTLRGLITDGGQGFTFVKVGPGLLTLQVRWAPNAPPGALNTWGQTIIKGGVLRRARNEALPDANILFDGGADLT